jgi:hypothetical protein
MSVRTDDPDAGGIAMAMGLPSGAERSMAVHVETRDGITVTSHAFRRTFLGWRFDQPKAVDTSLFKGAFAEDAEVKPPT